MSEETAIEVVIAEEPRPGAFFDEHDLAAIGLHREPEEVVFSGSAALARCGWAAASNEGGESPEH